MDPILLDAIEYNGWGISQLLSKGTIKSVQRGSVRQGGSPSGRIIEIDIAAVDPEKSFVIVDGMCFQNGINDIGSFAPAIQLTSNKLTLNGNNVYEQSGSSYFVAHAVFVSWQVIEFY